MKKVTAAAALTLFVLLPLVLGASYPYPSFLKDATLCQERDAVCKMSSGDYGCCPAADGVCCEDGDHCCPSGFKCDVSAKQCLQYGDPALYILTEDMLDVAPIEREEIETRRAKELTVGENMYRLEPAKSGGVGEVKCPDASSCNDGETCCLHINGGYGCCPDASGNCCDDYQSCCQSGNVCDVANGKCIPVTLEILDRIPFLVKSSSSRRTTHEHS